MIINNNLLGNTALNSLKSLGRGQQKSSEKLSTGSRITKASHDASGLAISNKMRAQIRGLVQAERNIADGKSIIETMDSGMSTICDMINRQRELTIQAMNDSNTAEDKEKIQNEINQLLAGIDDISNNTEFNGINLLSFPKNIEVNDSTVMTNLSEYYNQTGASVFNPDGSFNFVAMNELGETDRILNSNNVKINLDGTTLDLYTDFDGPTFSTIAEYSCATFTYTKNGYNIFIDQFVSIKDNGNGEDFIIDYQIYNFRDEINFELLLQYDIDFGDSTTPSYLLDNSATNISNDTILSGSELPNTMDLYNPLNPNINVAIPKIDLKVDEVWVGNHYNIDDFNFSPGSTIADSGYALLWENETIPSTGDNDTAYRLGYSSYIGVTDPRDNSELNNNIGSYTSSDLNLQIGANSQQLMAVERFDTTSESLGLRPIIIDSFESAETTLKKFDSAIEKITEYRAVCGANLNRLNHIAKSNGVSQINLESSNSKIADTDMAKEISSLLKQNVLTKSTTYVLSQANQSMEYVLQLLN